MPDILTHSDHNRLQAEYFGEAAVRWHHMGFDFMARHYAATAAHCARLAIEGLPSDLMTWQPVFTN